MIHHQSVFLNEAIEALNINPSGIYIDGTFGLGGHAKLILSKLTKNGRLIATDRDCIAVRAGELIAAKDKRLIIIHTPFSKILQYVQKMKLVGLVDGILLDLGICGFQLADVSRGFSFINDGLLDMRMDINTGQSAAKWLAKASQQDIEWVLKNFGEERFAKRISKSIIFRRNLRPIVRSLELSDIISGAIPYCNRYKRYKHPATRSFLAIRMYINNELNEITQVLQDSLKLLSYRGRLVIISFNSLEDRLVKRFIHHHSCFLPELPKLALTETQILNIYSNKYQLKNLGKLAPSIQEIKRNIRARSAMLRCAEKLAVCI